MLFSSPFSLYVRIVVFRLPALFLCSLAPLKSFHKHISNCMSLCFASFEHTHTILYAGYLRDSTHTCSALALSLSAILEKCAHSYNSQSTQFLRQKHFQYKIFFLLFKFRIHFSIELLLLCVSQRHFESVHEGF